MENNSKRSSKEVRKSRYKPNWYLIVYNYIKSGKNIQDIIFNYQIPKSSLQYYINRLKESNLIKKVGYGTWEIVKELELKEVRKKFEKSRYDGSIKEVRGHGFMFHLKLPKISNWCNRTYYLDKHKIKYIPVNIKGQRVEIYGRKVHLYTNSVIIYDKQSYIEKQANESKSKAIYNFLRIIKRLERVLNTSFIINKQYRFKVLKEHYGLIKNALARQYNDEGNRLNVYNDYGLWLVIDNSHNLHELETQRNRETNENQAVNDNEIVQDFFNDLKRNPTFQPSIINQLLSKTIEAQNAISNNQMKFAENIDTHIKAIQDLGNGVKELVKKIEKFK